ncbi:MAG: hypothetical protein CHACPFDD_01585 [Phycisphaerae bacterium]|nr:hypothetical protein [Phycisphaerae bacterium]
MLNARPVTRKWTAVPRLAALAALIAVCPALHATDWLEVQKLAQGDLDEGDHFGINCAIDGETIVIGSWEDDLGANTEAGSAYVFVRDSGGWTQEAKLVASDNAADDHFGWSVAIRGDLVAVGSVWDDHTGLTDAGSVYLFKRTAGVWAQVGKLTASDAAAGDYFGSSLAFRGPTLVIGASDDTHSGVSFAGSAYVFTESGGGWTETAKLIASDPDAFGKFGSAVGIVDADTIVVGSPADDHSTHLQAGSVYVFTRSGGVWSEDVKIVSSVPGDSFRFGASIATGFDRFLTGEYNSEQGGLAGAGATHVFVRGTSGWSLEATLTPSDAAELDGFGIDVAFDGGVAVIGAVFGDGVATDSGAAYVFRRGVSGWTEEAKFYATDGAANNWFGYGVAIEGGTAVAGAPFHTNGVYTGSGAAYVFEVCSPCDTNCDGSLNGFDVDSFTDLLVGSGTPCSSCAGDANGDGTVNGFDVDDFVLALTTGGC